MTRLLNTDEARLAVWRAIEAITIGNATDDKLIVANLAKAGVYLATQITASQEGEDRTKWLRDRLLYAIQFHMWADATAAEVQEIIESLSDSDEYDANVAALVQMPKWCSPSEAQQGVDAFFATPTPPTLSEDLREAHAGEGICSLCQTHGCCECYAEPKCSSCAATLSEDAAILAMSNAERAIERPDLPPLTALRMLAPEYERLRAMYRALAQVKAS